MITRSRPAKPEHWVKVGMPQEVMALMKLYPQPIQQAASSTCASISELIPHPLIPAARAHLALATRVTGRCTRHAQPIELQQRNSRAGRDEKRRGWERGGENSAH